MSKSDIFINVQKRFAQELVAQWFEGWDEVWIERDIITTRGEVMRPDRVVRKANTLMVIDYKTGQQDPAHTAQIKTYAQVLMTMYPQAQIAAWLWYITDDRIEPVALD